MESDFETEKNGFHFFCSPSLYPLPFLVELIRLIHTSGDESKKAIIRESLHILDSPRKKYPNGKKLNSQGILFQHANVFETETVQWFPSFLSLPSPSLPLSLDLEFRFVGTSRSLLRFVLWVQKFVVPILQLPSKLRSSISLHLSPSSPLPPFPSSHPHSESSNGSTWLLVSFNWFNWWSSSLQSHQSIRVINSCHLQLTELYPIWWHLECHNLGIWSLPNERLEPFFNKFSQVGLHWNDPTVTSDPSQALLVHHRGCGLQQLFSIPCPDPISL